MCVSHPIHEKNDVTLVRVSESLGAVNSTLLQPSILTSQNILNHLKHPIPSVRPSHSHHSPLFPLQDLLDLRKAGWVARRETERAQKIGTFSEEEKVRAVRVTVCLSVIIVQSS